MVKRVGFPVSLSHGVFERCSPDLDLYILYNKHVAYVRIEDGLSTAYTIWRGKARMYTISIVVFNLWWSNVREVADNLETRISVGGHIINAIRYADEKKQWWLTVIRRLEAL